MYVPLCFHGKGHRIHRRHTVFTTHKFTNTRILYYSLPERNRTAMVRRYECCITHCSFKLVHTRTPAYDCRSLTWCLRRWWNAQPSRKARELLHSLTKDFCEKEVIYPGISDTTTANNPLLHGNTIRAASVMLDNIISSSSFSHQNSVSKMILC
jgi:hypothetical protein